ncbi:MAG: polyprenyl synthetase family protein [Eubacteriales bacterium]
MENDLLKVSSLIDERLNILLNECGFLPKLRDAMKYSVLSGGKRLRPALNVWANELLDGDLYETLDIACAIEMIHTYSLIHDDLPAMDNDTLRRGQPTSHMVYGEGQAILVGDALLNYAFEVMLANSNKYLHNLQNHILAIRAIASASGPNGMIAGQWQDIGLEGQKLTEEELILIHKNKTAAIIIASLESGLLICSPNKKQLNAIRCYGANIGLAFQIIDDILDVTGSENDTGKTAKKDKEAGKFTYVDLYGIEKSQKIARQLTDNSINDISIFGSKAAKFIGLAEYLSERNH